MDFVGSHYELDSKSVNSLLQWRHSQIQTLKKTPLEIQSQQQKDKYLSCPLSYDVEQLHESFSYSDEVCSGKKRQLKTNLATVHARQLLPPC